MQVANRRRTTPQSRKEANLRKGQNAGGRRPNLRFKPQTQPPTAQQHVTQTSVAQPPLLYHQNGIQPTANPALHHKMASHLQGIHGLLQTPTVSTVSSLGCHQNTTQQYLAAAAQVQANSQQYSTVQKILIPGSKVS